MDTQHAILLNEIRYAERLTQRTARLYRHLSSAFVFIGVLGGSSVLASAAEGMPAWLSAAGLGVLAVAGALAIATKPLEKAVANEAEARKYAALRTKAASLTAEQLLVELQKARESDIPELELLREVAYNDLVQEVGRSDLCTPLNIPQRLVSALA